MKLKSILIILIASVVLLCGAIPASAELEFHSNYINGSTDGLFHPDGTLTRAEISQMLYSITGANGKLEKKFSDVPSGAWYETAVYALAGAGVMSGYTDGTFRPQKSVTRAEFFKLLAYLSGEKLNGLTSSYLDVPPTHWAAHSIALAEKKGWVTETGQLFKPDTPITRAEAVVSLNAYLGRVPDKSAIDLNPTARYFPDVTPDKWYYYDVMEASITHTVSIVNGVEKWGNVTRYKTALKDGFVKLNESIYLVKSGYIQCIQGNGSFNGVSYSSDETGSLTVRDGPVYLNGIGLCFIKNGKTVEEDGLLFTPSALYYIKDGLIVCNGEYNGLQFGPTGKYTSGNDDIDKYVDSIVQQITTSDMSLEDRLRACYNFIYGTVSYRANNNHVPRGQDQSEWVETYMLRLIDTGKGNCYSFAAEMFYFGRRVSCDPIFAYSGGVSPDNLDHGWAMIPVDGENLILDPELDKSSGPYQGSCFMVSLKDAPFKYWTD